MNRPAPSLSKGFTLIEMLVSVALFAIVMLMVASAYLVIIASNNQAQAVATGTNNLAFALETMARSIRTGSAYGCSVAGTDGSPCPDGFTFRPTGCTDSSCAVSYALSGESVVETINGQTSPLTGSAVDITSLQFYVFGSKTTGSGDYYQPQVTISISGTVQSGPGKTVPFTIETGASMRGTDL